MEYKELFLFGLFVLGLVITFFSNKKLDPSKIVSNRKKTIYMVLFVVIAVTIITVIDYSLNSRITVNLTDILFYIGIVTLGLWILNKCKALIIE